MAEPRSVPDTVDACQAEVVRLGFRLERADSEKAVYHLLDDRQGHDRVIERFTGELWTDLECAQAAVRFARYFLSEIA